MMLELLILNRLLPRRSSSVSIWARIQLISGLFPLLPIWMRRVWRGYATRLTLLVARTAQVAR